MSSFSPFSFFRQKPLTTPHELTKGLASVERYANTLTEDAIAYWVFHKRRFAWAVSLIMKLAKELGRPVQNILDIGPSYQTLLLEAVFPDVQIDTLGISHDLRFTPKHHPTVHTPFDLNDTIYPEKWPQYPEGRYDIIVMLEVIEHLYTSPRFVFSYLREIIPDHGVLVVQTPNAVSLRKRWAMAMGCNPYELIRETPNNPGHFREYTVKEMCQLAEAAGLEAVEVFTLNYFDGPSLSTRIAGVFWSNLREGMALVLRKKKGSGTV